MQAYEDWDKRIKYIEFAYNTSIHSSKGFSPFYLTFGREAQFPTDLIWEVNKKDEKKILDRRSNIK